MLEYHALAVHSVEAETQDSRRLRIDVPEALREEFRFEPGQHLPVSTHTTKGEIRRTYSICSAAGDWPLELGIRVQKGGQFSDRVLLDLRPGDKLGVMPPTGRFHAEVNPEGRGHYVGFAAGSGITPILAMMKTLLRDEAGSRFTLFYGNRRHDTTMFIEDLFALKNRYPDRLQLQFVFSREEQEFPIATGRLDREKTAELMTHFVGDRRPDACFVCGPDTMIDDVSAALTGLGIPPDAIHAERFGVPRKPRQASDTDASHRHARVTIIIDGHRKTFDMQRDDDNIVDAAAAHGINLPYSCKGGVCATCRTHLDKGKVEMAQNYGLEPWEVEAGFILACQSRPLSRELLLDYDKA